MVSKRNQTPLNIPNLKSDKMSIMIFTISNHVRISIHVRIHSMVNLFPLIKIIAIRYQEMISINMLIWDHLLSNKLTISV